MRTYKTTLNVLAAVVLIVVPATFGADTVKLQTETGTLFGTLELPEGLNSSPVALIISGSGPTDRDGNNPLEE